MIKRFLFLLIVLMPLCMFCTYAEDEPVILNVHIGYNQQYRTNIEKALSDKETQIYNGILIDRCLQNGRFQQNYTIDRRCYITDEQKKEFPYNAIVSVESDTGRCTGTLVKDDAGNLYVYTAAHCVPDRNAPLTVELQDGTTFSATPKLVGVGSVKQDVAILEIPLKNKISLPFMKKLPFVKVGQFNSTDRFNVIGYGGLAILSDRMIHEIKQNYANYMEINETELESNRNMAKQFQEFLEVGFDKGSIFSDGYNLKGSFDCSLRTRNAIYKGKPSGGQTDCQTYNGNSGGPIFDKDNNLVAVHTSGVGSGAKMIDEGYAATFLGGQEPVSDIQNQLYDYKFMIYHAQKCYVETNAGKGNYVDSTLCKNKDGRRSDWWMSIKNGKTHYGVKHCYNNDSYPGGTRIDFSVPGLGTGSYCWCRSVNNGSGSMDDMAYFSKIVYNSEKECARSCAYVCAKQFLGEDVGNGIMP